MKEGLSFQETSRWMWKVSVKAALIKPFGPGNAFLIHRTNQRRLVPAKDVKSLLSTRGLHANLAAKCSFLQPWQDSEVYNVNWGAWNVGQVDWFLQAYLMSMCANCTRGKVLSQIKPMLACMCIVWDGNISCPCESTLFWMPWQQLHSGIAHKAMHCPEQINCMESNTLPPHKVPKAAGAYSGKQAKKISPVQLGMQGQQVLEWLVHPCRPHKIHTRCRCSRCKLEQNLFPERGCHHSHLHQCLYFLLDVNHSLLQSRRNFPQEDLEAGWGANTQGLGWSCARKRIETLVECIRACTPCKYQTIPSTFSAEENQHGLRSKAFQPSVALQGTHVLSLKTVCRNGHGRSKELQNIPLNRCFCGKCPWSCTKATRWKKLSITTDLNAEHTSF